ncbi:natural killer cell receptor 2B4-like [Engraulis encrasicolus]|uniref:natural killer cell receptor 2B4-like n=1 Tax=Engraulis encrasicolus TaxID=184585 RepID=UPI002FD0B2D5
MKDGIVVLGLVEKNIFFEPGQRHISALFFIAHPDTGTLCHTASGLAVEGKIMRVVRQEGEPVTLQPQTRKLLSNERLTWTFTSVKSLSESQIIHSQLFRGEVVTEYNGIFKDSLLLNRETGSLTIRNISTSQSGLYHLQITEDTGEVTHWHFNCTVYAPVSVPNISKGTQLNSSRSGGQPLPRRCQVLCSVRHGMDVSLHWYKHDKLLSNTSTPDVNNTLSLHLDLDDQDSATYSCVAANPVSNYTSSLDITAVCLSGQQPDSLHPYLYYILAISTLMIATVIVVTAIWWKRTHTLCTAQELEEPSYADLEYRHAKDQKKDASHRTEHTPDTIYSAVVT